MFFSLTFVCQLWRREEEECQFPSTVARGGAIQILTFGSRCTKSLCCRSNDIIMIWWVIGTYLAFLSPRVLARCDTNRRFSFCKNTSTNIPSIFTILILTKMFVQRSDEKVWTRLFVLVREHYVYFFFMILLSWFIKY